MDTQNGSSWLLDERETGWGASVLGWEVNNPYLRLICLDFSSLTFPFVSTFISRLGNNFEAPDWFIAGLPSSMPLDGELWGGRGKFQSTVGIVKTKDKGDRWKEITYQVFDAPGLHDKTFEERTDAVKQFFGSSLLPFSFAPPPQTLPSSYTCSEEQSTLL